MADYQAKPGQEDRHGEMTGAISINMILTMLPTCVWCVLIGPAVMPNVWMVALSGVAIGATLTLLCRPLSQRIWAKISQAMDDSDY